MLCSDVACYVADGGSSPLASSLLRRRRFALGSWLQALCWCVRRTYRNSSYRYTVEKLDEMRGLRSVPYSLSRAPAHAGPSEVARRHDVEIFIDMTTVSTILLTTHSFNLLCFDKTRRDLAAGPCLIYRLLPMGKSCH
jgi:hypothetical protein